MSYQMQGLPFTLITQACMYTCASNWRLHLQLGAAGGRAKRAPLLVYIMHMILPALLVDIVPGVVVSVTPTLVSSAVTVVRTTVVMVATLVTSELLASVVLVNSVTGAIIYTAI